MRTHDLLRYAGSGLRGYRLRSSLSLLGVAIGVASVVLLTGLGEGARSYVTGEFASLGTNLLILLPGKTETLGAAPMVSKAPNDLTLADVEDLDRRIPRIRRIAPLVLGSATAAHGDLRRDALVIGTTSAMLDVRKLRMGTGRYLSEEARDAPVCVLGAKMARELFGSSNPLGVMIRIGGSSFRVIGVIAPRGTSIGMNMDEVIHVPVESAMRLFNRRGLFRALIEVGSHEAMPAVRTSVLSILQQRHGGEEDVTAITQDAVLATFDKILKILTAALAGIAAISLSVAGIGIMNVMLVSVSERTREIGLLKAIGVSRAQIQGIFLIEGAILSGLGGVLGLALALAGSRLFQAFVAGFHVRPPAWAMAAALATSIGVGLAFGSLPARRASRLDPVEALMRRRA